MVNSRTRPGFKLPIALNWFVTSWSSMRDRSSECFWSAVGQTSGSVFSKWRSAINISEKCQIQRITARPQPIHTHVFSRLVIENDDACKMQCAELRERYQGVIGVHLAGRVVHGIEQLSKLHLALTNNRRDNHEVRLRSHALLLKYLIACRFVVWDVIHVMT